MPVVTRCCIRRWQSVTSAKPDAAAQSPYPVGAMTRLPLRQYRFHFRPTFLEIDGRYLKVVLPVYFGEQVWEVPLANVLVCDLTQEIKDYEPPDLLFDPALKIPYLFTTGMLTAPTLELLFREPERVPTLRWTAALAPNNSLPFTRRQSKSEDGARVDGVLLRMQDNTTALAALVGAGVEQTQQPLTWLIRNRATVNDRRRVDRLLATERKIVWAARLQTVGFFGVWLTFLTDEGFPHPAIWAAVAAIALGWGVGRYLRSNPEKD